MAKEEKKKVVSKKTDKNNIKKQNKKASKEKKNIFAMIRDYFRNVRGEMKKTKWPTKKEMALYSCATLMFIVIFALFFTLNDVVISAVKQLVR